MSSSARNQMQSYITASLDFVIQNDTPSAFLERCISEIELREKEVKAFVLTDFDTARSEAREATKRWKAGTQLSPIDGMPIGIKDIMETARMPTQQGSALFKDWQGRRDCAAVVALREAGAIIVGKTVTTEFAATHPGVTCNPHDLERTPGGSSSGSAAAVGSGMLAGALGSQVIGSTIRPASYCGTYGYKPSIGGINRGGSFDGFSQSCTGIIAATLAECWVLTREITSRTGGDAGYVGVAGPMSMPVTKKPNKVAMIRTEGWARASDVAKSELNRIKNLFLTAGIKVEDVESDEKVKELDDAISNAMELSMNINAWEGRWPLDTYYADMDPQSLSESAHGRLKQAKSMTQEQFGRLIEERNHIRQIYAGLKEIFDVCVTLAAPAAAPKGLEWTGDPGFTVSTSLIGMPTVSLPILEDEGLPLGLQVIGFVEEDADLFAKADAILQLSQT